MCMYPLPIGSVPVQTALVAKAAFPKGNPYLTLRDELGSVGSRSCSPRSVSKRYSRGAPHWSLSYSFEKACQTVKLPTRCALASTGNTYWD